MDVFRFFLKRNQFDYYGVASDGSVTTTAIKKPLNHAPLDWKETEVVSKVSSSTFIPRREYSESIQFVLDGAQIVNHLFLTNGVLAKCFLLIEKLDTYTQSYNEWYRGELDFSTFSSDETSITINILERGLVGLLMNRKDVMYEIPFNNKALDLQISGVKMKSKSEWVLGNSEEKSAVSYNIAGQGNINTPSHVLSVPMFPYGDNVQAGNFISSLTVGNANYPQYYSVQRMMFVFDYDNVFAVVTEKWHNVNIYGQMPIGVWLDSGGGAVGDEYRVQVRLSIRTGDSTSQLESEEIDNIILGESDWISGSNVTYPYIYLNADIPEIPKDSHFVLYIRCITKNDVTSVAPQVYAKVQFFANTSIFKIKYNAKVPSSKAQGFRYIDFIKEYIRIMSNGQYQVESNFLSDPVVTDEKRFRNFDNSPFNTIVTNGLSLRGLNESVIKTKFSDIEKDLWARYGVDWVVVGNTIRFEPLRYFYNNNELMNLGSVGNLNISVPSERMYNKVSVGYQEANNDVSGGLFEFNTKTEYLSEDNTAIEADEDLIAPFRSDVYGIESLRSKTYNENSKDNKSDNEIFVIEINPEKVVRSMGVSYYKPLTFQNFNIVGVNDPDNTYNISLSPKRALYRHLARLRVLGMGSRLKFQTSDRNSQMESTLWAGNIKEYADVDFDNPSWTYMGLSHNFNHVFAPYEIAFDCEPPYNLIEVLNANTSKGYVLFNYKGNYFKGYILDIGIKPATRDVYRVRVLSLKENNISNIKRYY